MIIDRTARRHAEMILLDYPSDKKLYEEIVRDTILTAPTPVQGMPDIDEDYTKPRSVVEAKALKIYSNKRLERLKTKIDAVEAAMFSLPEEQRKVIQERYFIKRRKKTAYGTLWKLGYSERQMKRITQKVIIHIAKQMGDM